MLEREEIGGGDFYSLLRVMGWGWTGFGDGVIAGVIRGFVRRIEEIGAVASPPSRLRLLT